MTKCRYIKCPIIHQFLGSGGHVTRLATVGMLPVTSERLPDNRVVGLLEALGLLVEAGQVPLDHLPHPHQGGVLLHSSEINYHKLRGIHI